MKKLLFAALLALMPTLAMAQARTPDAIATDIETETKKLAALAAELKASLWTVVPAGGNLQAALNGGGQIMLTAGATYTGNFVVKSGTTLIGNGAKLVGVAGPAIEIAPGTSNVYISNVAPTTSWDQSIVRVGHNDSSQTTLAQAPQHITLDHIVVTTFRGKRAIEINSGDTRVSNSTLTDIYDGALSTRDSQAIWIGNASCAPCVIDHNTLSAGSENILIGGDTMKMIGVSPSDITISDNNIFKPLAWQTDGVNRAVKNLIELKAGLGVLITRNALDGSWHAAQDGYCFAITTRNMQTIQNVTVEDNSCDHVGGGFNILGMNDSTTTPAPLAGLVIRRNRMNINHVLYGGRGIMALITGGPHDVSFDSNVVTSTGNCMFYLDKPGSHPNADGTRSPNSPVAELNYTNNYAIAGTYGIIIGFANRDTPLVTAGIVDVLTVTGNTVADANGWTKKYFPTNTYLTRAEWDAISK
jgi:hypothetical protein